MGRLAADRLRREVPLTLADAAVAHVTREARAATPDARRRIAAVLGPGADADALGAGLFRRARVAVHFHPDRLIAGGLTVAGGLLRDGVCLSQFVTGVSAGGLTAFPGGERDRWKAALFGGVYQRPGVRPLDRPVYGALDLFGHADGPAPRFGSCRLLMHLGALELGPRDVAALLCRRPGPRRRRDGWDAPWTPTSRHRCTARSAWARTPTSWWRIPRSGARRARRSSWPSRSGSASGCAGTPGSSCRPTTCRQRPAARSCRCSRAGCASSPAPAS